MMPRQLDLVEILMQRAGIPLNRKNYRLVAWLGDDPSYDEEVEQELPAYARTPRRSVRSEPS
jgi:hypothetical protein